MMAKISTSISRGMPAEIARARIEDFRDTFDAASYYFAQHAAFPLALTPDLLYRMRESFQRTSDDKRLDIPWIAIADLLLSPLCEEADIGYELYEMDISIRAQLLDELRANPDFGEPRITELAYFLRNYVEEQLTGPDPMILDLAQSQTWTALAYIKPDQAAHELAEAIKVMYSNGSLEQVRITSIMESLNTLATPLATREGFQPLLTYAQLQAHATLGHTAPADTPAQLEQAITQVATTLKINLPTDRKATTHASTGNAAPGTDFYISHHIADHDWAEWIARQLQDTGYSVNRSFQFGPASGLDIDSPHNQARHTIALLSPDYLAVDNVQKEWTELLAPNQQTQHTLLPLRVRACTPHGIFASIQYLDLVGQNEVTAHEMLLQFVRQSLNRRTDPAPDPAARRNTSIKIFISSAHQDQQLVTELKRHLSPLEQQGLISVWDYSMILPGTEWQSAILTNLDDAQIILFLVSPDFLASDFGYSVELQRAMERSQRNEARLIPILLKTTEWKILPFANLQALPSNGRAINAWPNRNEAFADVVRGIQKVIEELSTNKPPEADDDERKIQALERKAKLDQDAAAYSELGRIYERLRRIEDAIRAYEEAWSIQSARPTTPGSVAQEDIDLLFALSRLYNDTGLYERAIQSINRLIELQPNFADAYKQRGLVYRRQADADYATSGDGEKRTAEYTLAIADLERAVELQPDFEDALGSLGGLYRRMNNYERAREYYQRLYSVNPSSSYALGNLASLSWYLGRRDEARSYFGLLEQASQMRLKEERDEAYWDYYDLALAQLATGKIAVAKATYAQAIEETPAIAQYDAVLSNLYFLQQASEPISGLEEIIALLERAKLTKRAGNA